MTGRPPTPTSVHEHNRHTQGRGAAAATDSAPPGADERVAGFGPWASRSAAATIWRSALPGVVLRPRVSLGVAPHSIREWTFYATTPAEQSCSRYFSSATTVPAVE